MGREIIIGQEPVREYPFEATPASTPVIPDAIPMRDEEKREALFPTNDLENLRRRWKDVQGNFVDEPRKAVEEADQLVNEVVQKLTQVFATERQKLEDGWGKKSDSSTEDLRMALRRYRSFFDRLLTL